MRLLGEKKMHKKWIKTFSNRRRFILFPFCIFWRVQLLSVLPKTTDLRQNRQILVVGVSGPWVMKDWPFIKCIRRLLRWVSCVLDYAMSSQNAFFSVFGAWNRCLGSVLCPKISGFLPFGMLRPLMWRCKIVTPRVCGWVTVGTRWHGIRCRLLQGLQWNRCKWWTWT